MVVAKKGLVDYYRTSLGISILLGFIELVNLLCFTREKIYLCNNNCPPGLEYKVLTLNMQNIIIPGQVKFTTTSFPIIRRQCFNILVLSWINTYPRLFLTF